MSNTSKNDTQYHSNDKCSKCHDHQGVYYTNDTDLIPYHYLCTSCRNKIRIELRNVFYKKINY